MDMFNAVKRALVARDLELSASTFISDFEHNIRLSFNEVFPNVKPQGCYFHYGKAIWSRVKKSGMASYYSKKGSEPKFGLFVRLIIGLPFVKIADIPRGLKNIENVAKQFKTKKCQDFAHSMLLYIDTFWMKLPLELWNVFNVKDRTNNLAEGYNYALGAKKVISKHPNPYTLVSVIKDELNIASDDALSIVMSKPRRPVSKKFMKLETRRKELMQFYDRGNMELYIYQATIGNAYLNNFNRVHDDVDPDPYGTGIIQSELHDSHDSDAECELASERSYFEDELSQVHDAECELPPDADEVIELTFEDNLCVKVKKNIVPQEKNVPKAKKIEIKKFKNRNPIAEKVLFFIQQF